jgi:hypothetical protein
MRPTINKGKAIKKESFQKLSSNTATCKGLLQERQAQAGRPARKSEQKTTSFLKHCPIPDPVSSRLWSYTWNMNFGLCWPFRAGLPAEVINFPAGVH